MPSVNPTPGDSARAEAELQDVREWLEQTGYPLEMRVAQSAIAHGASIQQGYRYNDPATGKEREGDVYAVFMRPSDASDDPVNVHYVELAIECKSTSEPSVVFVGALPGMNPWVPWAFRASQCRACDGIGRAHYGLLNADTQAIGYSITSKRRRDRQNDRDLAYAAVQQAANAAAATYGVDDDENAEEARTVRFQHEYGGPVMVTVPVVVTSGSLVICQMKADGQIDLDHADRATVRVTRSGLPDYTADSIDVLVVTEGGFNRLLDDVEAVVGA